MASSYLQAMIAATALELATLFLVAAVTVLQCCFVRRQGDEARAWIIWARRSSCLYTFLLVILCSNMLIKVIHRRFLEQDILIFQGEERGVTQAFGFLDAVFALGEAVFRVLLLVTFASLCRGLALARNPGGQGSQQQQGWQRMRSAAIVAGGLTLMLASVLFGLCCRYWTHLYDDEGKGGGVDKTTGAAADLRHDNHRDKNSDPQSLIGNTITCIGLTLHIMWFVLSLCVLALASRTLALSHTATVARNDTRWSSKLLVLGALLFAAQPLYGIILYSLYYMGGSDVPSSGPDVRLPVTDVIFRVWPYSSVLLVLYGLGRKKMGGVWSTGQQQQQQAAHTRVYKTPWGFEVVEHLAPDTAQTQQTGEELNKTHCHDSQVHLEEDTSRPGHHGR